MTQVKEMPNLSLVVPVYCNAGSLPALFKRLLDVEKVLISHGVSLQLIFVDDGSTDESWSELIAIKTARPQTTLLKLARNFGANRASKTGLRYATGDCFMLLAADLQDPPELIPDMVERWLSGEKFIIAVRSNRNDSSTSTFMNAIYYTLLRFYIAPDYPVGGFDMMILDGSLLKYFVESNKSLYFPVMAHWLGFKPYMFFYERMARVHGKSGWSFIKKFNSSLDVLLGFSVAPLRLICMLGVAVSLFSMVYGSWILLQGYLGHTEVRGFATIVTLISFFGGMTSLMLGLIGEYIWRIFQEVDRRPETVIDQIL